MMSANARRRRQVAGAGDVDGGFVAGCSTTNENNSHRLLETQQRQTFELPPFEASPLGWLMLTAACCYCWCVAGGRLVGRLSKLTTTTAAAAAATRFDNDLAWLDSRLALCFLFRVPRCYWRFGVAVLAAANTKATTREEHARPLLQGPPALSFSRLPPPPPAPPPSICYTGLPVFPPLLECLLAIGAIPTYAYPYVHAYNRPGHLSFLNINLSTTRFAHSSWSSHPLPLSSWKLPG